MKEVFKAETYKTLLNQWIRVNAEFQQACESIAGISLIPEFVYIYTTREIDYSTYLSHAGLKIAIETVTEKGNRKITISRMDNMNTLQQKILQSWLGE